MILPGPPQVAPLKRAEQKGLHQNSKVGSVLQPSSRGLEARALPGHAPLPRRIISPTLPPALRGGAGPQSEECRLGARRPGHIPGETLGLGGKFAQLASAKADSRAGGQPR